MSMGTMILAGMLYATCAAPGDVPADVVPFNQRTFDIPLTLKPNLAVPIREVLLYSSNDEGHNWQYVAASTPDKLSFRFNAPADGLYWFAVMTVDVQGVHNPPDVNHLRPRQKILVDTTQPTLRIVSADREGDQIMVRWETSDEHPSFSSLRLEYRTPDAAVNQWYSAPPTPGPTGTTAVRAPVSSPVSIRMQVADAAGNTATATAEVPAAPPILAASATGGGPAPAPASQGLGGTQAGPGLTGGPVMSPMQVPTPPPVPPAGTSWESGRANLAGAPPVEPVRMEPGRNELRSQEPALPQANVYQQQAPGAGGRWIASTDGSAGTVLPAASLESQPTDKRMPAVQLVHQPQIALDYDVVKVGPSGVGRAEVWMTRDDGRNWEKFANVDDLKQGPLIVDLGNQADGAREGVYGFTLIVYSKAGLARRPPLSGEPPDIRVELDMTPPDAKIGVPEQDPKDRNSLVLRWSANDRNLDAKPIALFWSKQHDGPWQPIGTDLTNSGHFTWHLPPDPPERVFLRLSVRDRAGNVSDVVTPSAVLVDLSEPEVHLRGVASTYRQP